MKLKEIWKDILQYDGQYQVSNKGRVRSFKRNKSCPYVLKFSEDKDGYLCVVLSKNGHSNKVRIHRIVAETFLTNPDRKPTVNHKDGDKHNNCVENLEWATRREQIQHVISNDLRSPQSVHVLCIETGQEFPSKRSAETTLGIRKNGVSTSIRTGKPVNGFTFKEVKRVIRRTSKKLFSL